MESSTRPLANGAVLPQYIGQTVTLFGTVIKTESNGMSFDMMTSDRHVVTVSMRNTLMEPLIGVVEVHGIVKGKNTLICNYYMGIPAEIASNFDNDVVNEVVTLIHSVPNAWKVAV